MKMSAVKKTIGIISAIGLFICIVFSVYAINSNLFTSVDALKEYLSGFGALSALVFIGFQAVQVVMPILPGGLGCLAGVLIFGPWFGFLYNYIGICIGSLAAFAIARTLGKPIIHALFNERLIMKYDAWTDKESQFAKWLAIAIFFPVAPDDFLCYLAGTTKLSWKKFTAIILLGKPFSITLYSLGLNVILQSAVSVVQ
ncbi:TVP38/TMEM64 family protein [Lachnospiraceae bacterium 54-53]